MTTVSRKSFVFVGVMLAVVAVVDSENKLPNYIEVCKRNDPYVEDCILNSVERLRPKLLEGIPELDVPKLDPLLIPEVKVVFGSQRTAGFRAVGHNVLVYGASNFKVSKLKLFPVVQMNVGTTGHDCFLPTILHTTVDIANHKFFVGLDIPELYFVADYDINVRFALLPVKGRGPIHANATGIKGDVVLNGDLVQRDGGEYIRFGSVEVDLKIEDFHVKLENLFRGDTILTEATNNAINGNAQEFLQSLLPVVERTVGSVLLDIANNITKNFTYDEIFPKE